MKPIGRLHVLVDTVQLAEAALEGGASTVQARVKTGPDQYRYETVAAIVERCRDADATCLVNDRADFALAAGAHGVHVGAQDLSVSKVRQILGPDAIVGATARDPVTGRQLADEGASYLGVGPMFATDSKIGLPEPLGVEGVRAVVEAVDVPVIAIAGITEEHVPEVFDAGAWGVAVIGAVSGATDPHKATHDLAVAIARTVEALSDTR